MGKMVRLDESRTNSSNRSENRGSSGVLARAREYNRIIDENRSRSRSGERKPTGDSEATSPSKTTEPPISKSGSNSRGMSTKERAMMSLDADAFTSGRSISPIKNGSKNQNHQAQGNFTTGVNSSKQPQSMRINPIENNTGNNIHSGANGKSPVNYQAVFKQSSPEQHQKKSSSLNSKPTSTHQTADAQQTTQGLPAVTPELLVDALSGHEDGLLAIAERLMEHYDEGYDSMGEAIIDAFADVQKLFQHVVEAAHMEGAAYEAGRREEEFEKLKKSGVLKEKEATLTEPTPTLGKGDGEPLESASPQSRHEEFIDEDVREILEHAVSEGRLLKDTHKYSECYVLYEEACQSASALLPVDSDHRGRLQLSLARAESMNPERACAMLKYVIDDVLRSGLDTNTKIVMPDPSKRGDCVLQRPTPLKKTLSNVDATSKNHTASIYDEGNLQRSEELLASLVEEMKEVLSAPMYANCHPLQDVASRFWVALTETQRNNLKNEERLEQKLGSLKGEFLLAREVCFFTLLFCSNDCRHEKYSDCSRSSNRNGKTSIMPCMQNMSPIRSGSMRRIDYRVIQD